MHFGRNELLAWVAVLIAAPAARAQGPPAPIEIVLVDAKAATSAAVAEWKKEGFKGVAIVLDDQTSEADYREPIRRVSEAGLDHYYWIEVGRNPTMATKNPRWMAALGAHQDWQTRFPKFPEPSVGEVAKAFLWVPIVYQEAFDAHLARIDQLLKRAPGGWRGLLLNDLQGGPSSCGCGNIQCRWAVDYYMPPTATKIAGDDVAARFVSEVRKRVGDKSVIPIWTTECEDVDLPSDKHDGLPSTGLCGTVGCGKSACPEAFANQWSALQQAQNGPTGLLTVHASLQRTRPEFGGGPGWLTNSIGYLNRTLLARGGKAFPSRQLWAVVDGTQKAEEAAARKIGAAAGVGAVIVARVKIDQSYEPKAIRTN
ncbi:MAG: hypothetical protein HYR88_03580 [Verrucomicrobia bacterium]|nr:hypothetical protein [Verrucomicrobiota bacterium]MBI3868552.1 hypothetical protein [Verrucomicrobiota bacterium]